MRLLQWKGLNATIAAFRPFSLRNFYLFLETLAP